MQPIMPRFYINLLICWSNFCLVMYSYLGVCSF